MKIQALVLALLGSLTLHVESRVSQSRADALREWKEGRRHFVIITATYNNAEWYKNNLDSVLGQTYSDFHVVITESKMLFAIWIRKPPRPSL